MLLAMLMAVTQAATVNGFEAPESAYWDAASHSWFVSNIAGTPSDKDGKGWISRLDSDGKVVQEIWVDGFNAPKGLRVSHGILYVADIDDLVLVDIARAEVKERIKAPGATFLNDLDVGPGGDVYVSDTLQNAIYRCAGGHDCQVFLKSEALEGPNGLLLEGGHLVVAAFGLVTDPETFATKAPGRLLRVDLKTKAVKPLGDGKPIGNLDGLEKDGDAYLVTDFMAGKLLRVSKAGAVTVLKEGLETSADLGYDAKTHRVAVPELGRGAVQFLQVAR